MYDLEAREESAVTVCFRLSRSSELPPAGSKYTIPFGFVCGGNVYGNSTVLVDLFHSLVYAINLDW